MHTWFIDSDVHTVAKDKMTGYTYTWKYVTLFPNNTPTMLAVRAIRAWEVTCVPRIVAQITVCQARRRPALTLTLTLTLITPSRLFACVLSRFVCLSALPVCVLCVSLSLSRADGSTARAEETLPAAAVAGRGEQGGHSPAGAGEGQGGPAGRVPRRVHARRNGSR